MRILVVSDLWSPFPGGAETYIVRLTDALVKRGHDISILTSYAKAKSDLPITIRDIGVRDRHVQGVGVIAEYLINPTPDLIITHHFFAGEFADLWSEITVPFVELIHNRPRHPKAALAVFNSQYTANRSGFHEGDMVMLPPAGVDCVVSNDWRLRTPVLADCIGHIKPIPGKGIEITYQLARIMSDRKFLVLRGEWQDVELIRDIPNVEFVEPVDDIRDFYARCRLLLMPSLSEDAGTVPQECALNGIPCISSNVMGLPETNFGGITLGLDSLEPWITEIVKCDHADYYAAVTERQRLYVESLNFEARFDELDAKIRQICAIA